jgi:hypothetical protein
MMTTKEAKEILKHNLRPFLVGVRDEVKSTNKTLAALKQHVDKILTWKKPTSNNS